MAPRVGEREMAAIEKRSYVGKAFPEKASQTGAEMKQGET